MDKVELTQINMDGRESLSEKAKQNLELEVIRFIYISSFKVCNSFYTYIIIVLYMNHTPAIFLSYRTQCQVIYTVLY